MFSRHIDRAEGVVNAKVGAYYDPASWTATSASGANVPPLIRTLSEDIASWFALRGGYVQDGQRKEAYLDEYKRALDTLDQITDGKLKLLDTSGSEVGIKTTSRFQSSTEYAHIFNLDSEENWQVDQDQIDDIENTR